jgi:hypothetical protein
MSLVCLLWPCRRELEAYQDAMMTFTVRDWDDTTAGVDAARRLRDENKRLVRRAGVRC